MTNRYPQLDVLRGIAILLVLGHHYAYYTAWQRGGWMGVDLFFVLSGFLISGLLFQEHKTTGEINFRQFFIRRGFKIYPAYFCFLLFTLPLSFHDLRLRDFLFMQAYYKSFWGHCWSLSVEEHFYIALPLILMASAKLLPRSRFAWIPMALPFVVVICLSMRAFVSPVAPFEKIGSPTHLRFDALFAGVALGWLYHFRPEMFRVLRSHGLVFLALLLVGWEFVFQVPSYVIHTVGYTANLLGFSLLLLWAMNRDGLSTLKPLGMIGRYSYSIYLWHVPLGFLFAVIFRPALISFWMYLPAAIMLGIGMSALIEMPLLAIRDRYFPAHTRSMQRLFDSLKNDDISAGEDRAVAQVGVRVERGSAP